MFIKAIDPLSIKTYGEGRTFEVCPLTPLVRRRLFAFLRNLLDEIPEDVLRTFKKTEYDIRNITKIACDFVEYIETAGKLEKFIAVFIRDVGVSDREKDIEDIANYLTLNCPQAKELEMFANFFKIISFGEIVTMWQLMKSNLTKSLIISEQAGD